MHLMHLHLVMKLDNVNEIFQFKAQGLHSFFHSVSPFFPSLVLSCSVPAGAEGKITWLKDGKEINDVEKVLKEDEAASKMIIKKATMQDAGRYTCRYEFNSRHSDETEMQLYVYGT